MSFYEDIKSCVYEVFGDTKLWFKSPEELKASVGNLLIGESICVINPFIDVSGRYAGNTSRKIRVYTVLIGIWQRVTEYADSDKEGRITEMNELAGMQDKLLDKIDALAKVVQAQNYDEPRPSYTAAHNYYRTPQGLDGFAAVFTIPYLTDKDCV